MAYIQEDGNPDALIDLQQEPTPADIEKAAALALVVQDAEIAEGWIAGKQWHQRWDEIDVLYDSPRVYDTWEQVGVGKPNVSRFIVARHVNSILPQLLEGLFYEDPYFVPKSRPGTDSDAVRARAAMITFQLSDMDFQKESGRGLFQAILHGTGIWKWGMETVKEEDLSYSRSANPITQKGPLGEEITVHTPESDTFKEEIKYKIVWKPFLENREIREVLVAPSLKLGDIREAKYVIDKYYLTLDDLLELKDNDPSYDLPAKSEIRSWFTTPVEPVALEGSLDSSLNSPVLAQGEPDSERTTQDPSEQGLLILERWDNNKVITVLNGKKVIRNQKNPFGVIPFYSSYYYPGPPRSFWGLGVGRMVGIEQRLNQGLTNSGLALLQLMLDPPFVISEDADVPSQNLRFRKGGLIKVKGSAREAIVPIEMPKLPLGELFAFLQNSETEAESADGANELLVQGAMPGAGASGKSSITRTGTGVNALSGASASRLQGPVDCFINQVMIPWIYQLDELNRRFLPMDQMRAVLGDELGEDFSLDEQRFLRAKVEFDCLAGARLAAKKTMAQSLPLITQIFENPNLQQQLAQINEEYIDVKELVLMWLEASGWPNRRDLIKKMSADMKQRQQANNPGAQKVQGQATLEDQKFQHQQKLQAQKGEIGVARDALSKSLDKAGDEVLRQADEKAATPEAITGEASPTGFGG